jgi:hypothetical protein
MTAMLASVPWFAADVARADGDSPVARPVSDANAEAIGIMPSGLSQIEALMAEKASRTSVQRKISSSLLYAAAMANGRAITPGVQSLSDSIADDISGRSKVKLVGAVTPRLLVAITSVGGTVLESYPNRNAVYAMVDVRALEQLAALPEVLAIRRPAQLRRETGPIDSQGDTTHDAISARSAYGVGGAGVSVGILSDSANAHQSLTHSKSTGEITTTVTVVQDDPSGTDEGDAMMEIVADLAPQSPMFFATAALSEEGFADNILQLQQLGCTVIGDDVGYSDEPVYQDGLVAEAVNDVVSDGVAYFSAAGNEGNVDAYSSTSLSHYLTPYEGDSWEGPFVDSGLQLPSAIPASKDGSAAELHTFNANAGAAGLYNHVTFSDYSFAVLQWSDPFYSPTDDYDLYVLNSSGTTVVAASTDIQDGEPGQEAIEAVSPTTALTPSDRIYVVRYHHDTVNNYPQRIFLSTLSDGANALFYATDGGTFGHCCAAGAYGVAAAPATPGGFNASFTNLTSGPYPSLFTSDSSYEEFSSAGPRIVYYDSNGDYLSPGGAPVVRLKPDVTAADGVSTGVSGFAPFYGTSAATPHAVAITALLKSHAPALTLSEIRATLTGSALHTNTSVVPVEDVQGEWNADMGYGIVMAHAALDFTGAKFIGSISVTPISWNSATVSWLTTLPATGELQYGTGSGFTATPVASTNDVTGLIHSATLTGLTPATVYNYRIDASTTSGSLNLLSTASTFTTAPAPTGTPALVATSAVGATAGATQVQVTITLQNSGVGTAFTTTVTAATLNGIATTTTPLPTVGTVYPGGSASVTLDFPASAVKASTGSGRGQQNLVNISTKTAGTPTYSFSNPIAVISF